MVWCGVVWCGVVWCGVVWRGMVWCGVVAREIDVRPFPPSAAHTTSFDKSKSLYFQSTHHFLAILSLFSTLQLFLYLSPISSFFHSSIHPPHTLLSTIPLHPSFSSFFPLHLSHHHPPKTCVKTACLDTSQRHD